MIIPLGVQSPARSSSLPASSWSERAVPRRLFGLAPAGVYPAATVTGDAVRSYRTFSPLPDPARMPADGGVFSVALSVARLQSTAAARPGVTWQPALRSPDFPRAAILSDLSRDHPADAHHLPAIYVDRAAHGGRRGRGAGQSRRADTVGRAVPLARTLQAPLPPRPPAIPSAGATAKRRASKRPCLRCFA